MAFFAKEDLKDLYTQSKSEGDLWRIDYPAYERLMDNGLLEGLDPNLPEVNDGSLAAALFKLPKRVVSSKLSGTVKAIDRDEAWMSELANLQWRNEIVPKANMQAPFHRKWKDAVRKAAGYGGIPLITLFVDKDGERTTDFIVAPAMDVTLEAGKVSDLDSDVIFWDVYFSKKQMEDMIEQAEAETKTSDDDDYSKWDVPALKKILADKQTEERTARDSHSQNNDKGIRRIGFKFCVAFQRGVEAPFYMYYPSKDLTVREWSNDDPTGDIPVHYLYCYQDMINPYGTGIVKLAGGTQNVLDYMRQADVLGTQLAFRPPIKIKGNADEVDLDSIVYAQDALWFVGNADAERQELSNDAYRELPNRISMYKTSLNQLIPVGDTSISASAGDPEYSKTPAGVKFQAANLSVDDEDFKDNLYITYAAVAKSMINIKFANMEGTDLMKLTDDERDILMKAGLTFEPNEVGELSNQIEIVWDESRAKFDFEVDPELDKTKDDQQKLEGLTKVAELVANPAFQPLLQGGQPIFLGNKKLDPGELLAEIVALTTDNDKIITDVTPDEEAGMQQDAAMQQQMALGAGQPPAPQQGMSPAQQAPGGQQTGGGTTPEMTANIQAVMEQYGVDEQTATTALAAEAEGLPLDQIIEQLQKHSQTVMA